MSRTPNYSNPKVAKKLDATIQAIAKVLLKLEAASKEGTFRKSEMKELVLLAKKLSDSIQFFDGEIQKQESAK